MIYMYSHLKITRKQLLGGVTIELLLVIVHRLLQALPNFLGKLPGILMTYPTRLFALSVIHISQIVQGSSFAEL